MADIDWAREVEEASCTPADALRWFLGLSDYIEDIVIVAKVGAGAPENVADSVVMRSNSRHQYRRLGLLHEGLNLQMAAAIEAKRDLEDD